MKQKIENSNLSESTNVTSPSFTPRELIYRKMKNPEEKITDELIENLKLDIYNYSEDVISSFSPGV
jgi:hypothetical protein